MFDPIYEQLAEQMVLVNYSPGYKLGEFDCGIPEYNVFIQNDAESLIDLNFTQIKLLINKNNADVVGYIALCSDSFFVDKAEKEKYNIQFSTFPALKIGKLAIDRNYLGMEYGSYMIEIAYAIASKFNDQLGVACRFLTVDADTRYNKNTPCFYLKNGFVFNLEKELRILV